MKITVPCPTASALSPATRSRPARTTSPSSSSQARLVEPGAAFADEVQLAGVVVVDHDVVADMGKAGGGDEADVAGADHGDAHAGRLLGSVK